MVRVLVVDDNADMRDPAVLLATLARLRAAP